MLSKKMERCLSFLMAMIMLFSLMPVSALATEEETHDHSAEVAEQTATATEETVPAEEPNPVIEEIQLTMDDILAYYLGSADVTAEEVPNLCALLDEAVLADAKREAIGLEGTLQEYLEEGLLTQDEYDALMAANPAYVVFVECVTAEAGSSGVSVLADPVVFYPLSADATLNTDSRITVSIADADDALAQGSMIGAFVKTLGDGSGGVTATKTATITITNNTTSYLEISFDWTAAFVSDLTVDGEKLATDVTNETTGKTTKMMAGGASIVVKLTSSDKAVVESSYILSNFSAAEPTGAQVKILDASGNATYDGAAVADGDVVSVPEAGGTLATGATNFVAWINADTGTILSSAASFTLTAASDMTVKALYSTSAIFGIGTDKRFDDLNTANAVAGSGSVIFLTNNGTLPAGNYTIKSGVTLLIPFDSSNTCYTTEPGHDDGATWVSPTTSTAFRTLTMASGANITVASGGAISVSAKHHSGGTSGDKAGSPTGPVGFIKMNSGSNITVQSGGALYAWGYITGSGAVSIEGGGTVYEYFQFNDFRGGTHTSWATGDGKTNKVFPLNSYFVQNVEVPMTLHNGAMENCYMSVHASVAGYTKHESSPISFIGDSGAMFKITSGYVVKRYDGANDRLVFDVHGNVQLTSISLNVYGTDISASDYVLPLNSNITININSGKVNVVQAIAMLPGTEVTVASGAQLDIDTSVYIYDSAEWLKTYCYPQDYTFRKLAFAPGRTGDMPSTLPDAKICINGTADATDGKIYTTSSGANIYSTGNGSITMTAGTESETYQYSALAYRGKEWYDKLKIYDATVANISITSAQLKNADGSYVATAGASDTTYNYNATHGCWYAGEHTETVTATTDPTCVAAGTKTVKCACGYTATVEDTSNPATGAHIWNSGSVTSEATCTETGVKTFTCTVCTTATKTETIPATNHEGTTEERAQIDATCVATGNAAGTYCTACNKYISGGAVIDIDPDAHSFTQYTKSSNAACGVNARETATCDRCDATNTRDIEGTALEHNFEGAYQINTDGTHSQKCTNSGCEVYGNETAHTYNQSEAEAKYLKTEANCQSAAVYYKSCVCGAFSDSDDAATFTDGDKAAANHVEEASVWEKDAEGHRQYWSCCNLDVVTKTAHTFENGVCSVEGCGYECEHAGGKLVYTSLNNDTHKAVYDCCGKVEKDAEACTDTTNKDHMCDVCGTKLSDCTDGNNDHNCDVCGEELSELHSYTDWKHSEDKHWKECSCGAKSDEIAHDFADEWKNDAINHWHECECGAKSGETTHNYNIKGDVVSAATCKDYAVYKAECVCGAVNGTISGTELDCNNHVNLQSAEAKPSTCTEQGWNAYEYCDGCDYTTKELLPLADHSWTDATCTTAKTCSVCSATEGAALGHSYEIDTLSNQEQDITWTKIEGRYKCEVKGTCQRCGDATVVSAISDDGLVTTPATCTEDGQTTYTANFTESWIGKQTVTYTDIKALDHDYEEEVTKAATCTDAGVKTFTCKRDKCGHSYTEAIAATGHTLTQVEAKAATCTEAGYEAYEHCSVCDYTTYKEVAATGHVNTTETVVDATCTEEGSKTVTCSCGEVISTETIAATGHSYSAVVTAPTCTVEGYTTYTCSECGDSYVADKVAAAGHKYDAVVTEPTCTEKGYTTYTCSCGDTYIADETEAAGHKYDAGVVTTQPGCETEGVKTFTCSCGVSYTETVAATGHNWVVGEAVWSGSKDNGYTCSVTRTCACGKTETATTTNIDSSETKAPTCISAGETTYVAIFPDDQSWARVETVTKVYGDIPVVDHTWDEGEITTVPTYETASVKTFTCTVDGCGETKDENIKVAEVDGVQYEILKEALTKVSEGGTVTLLVDFAETETITIAQAVTINRNGKTATIVAGEGFEIVDDGDDAWTVQVAEDKMEYDSTLKFAQTVSLSYQSYIGLQASILKKTVDNYGGRVYVELNGEEISGLLYAGVIYVYEKQVLSTDMTDEFTFTIYGEKNGKTYIGESVTVSVESRALSMIQREHEKADGDKQLCTLLVDMLNYGAAVQDNFNSQKPKPDRYLDSYQIYATKDDPDLFLDNEIGEAGTVQHVIAPAMSLQSILEIQIGFKDTKGLTPRVINTVDGSELEGARFESYAGFSILRIPVGAINVRTKFEVTLYDSEGNPASATYILSVEGFAKNAVETSTKETQIKMYNALMKYGNSVYEKFGQAIK